MTIQVTTPNQSKPDLCARLNGMPRLVKFAEPLPAGTKIFDATEWPKGHEDIVVCDPLTRMRFAKIVRKMDGTFIVK